MRIIYSADMFSLYLPPGFITAYRTLPAEFYAISGSEVAKSIPFGKS